MRCLLVWSPDGDPSEGFHITTPAEIENFFENVDNPNSDWYNYNYCWDEL